MGCVGAETVVSCASFFVYLSILQELCKNMLNSPVSHFCSYSLLEIFLTFIFKVILEIWFLDYFLKKKNYLKIFGSILYFI